jgi:HPt (histidine-containing phosphotransfer) domain-containing protein
MNDSTETLLRAAILRLGQGFLERTQSDLARLQALVVRVHAGESAALEALRDLSHRIHGGGATFGFARISECAAHLEQLCAELEHRQSTGGADRALAERLESLAHALEDALEQHAALRPLQPP